MYVCIQSNLYVDRALILKCMLQRVDGGGLVNIHGLQIGEKMEFLTQVKKKYKKLTLHGDSTLLHTYQYLEHFYRPV